MAKVRSSSTKRGKKNKRINKLLPQKPKRAGSQFGAFLKEFWVSLEDPKTRTRDSLKEAAIKWKAMSEEQKVPYQNLVASDRNRYAEQMALWKRQRAFLTRPATMYALFMKDAWQRARMDGENPSSVENFGKRVCEEWRVLSVAEKDVYKQRFERASRNYQLSIRDFSAGLQVNLDRQLEEEYVPLLPLPNEPLGNDLEFDWDDEDEDFDFDEDMV